MNRCGDYGYRADEGMHFVATEKAKEWASYRNCVVGEPLDDDDTYAVKSMVDAGAVREVPDPEWVTMPGYRAVYDVHGDGKYIFDAGNPIVYHSREMAEAAVDEFNKRPWNHQKAYVIDAIYKGKRPKACREYEGKPVYNRDHWSYNRPIGSLVEREIAEDAGNCVPPRTWTRNMIQCGEPAGSKVEGITYATFIRVTEDIWKWCGNCFAGESEERGKEVPYV